ncbi:MAG: hypothetical protein AAF846_08760 [Chloroflexota bacterium]
MSDLPETTNNETTTPPPPPAEITDADQIAAGEERWQECPLKDCKRDVDLLYEDFYLRGIRSNRLMCSKCAVRVEMGYMAREEVCKSDDRFFQGTQRDNLVVLGVMFVASLIANVISSFVWFYFAFLIGGGAGGAAAPFARRLAGKRVTRQMHLVGGVGIAAGAIVAYLFIVPNLFSIVICSFSMGAAAWGILQRRI